MAFWEIHLTSVVSTDDNPSKRLLQELTPGRDRDAEEVDAVREQGVKAEGRQECVRHLREVYWSEAASEEEDVETHGVIVSLDRAGR